MQESGVCAGGLFGLIRYTECMSDRLDGHGFNVHVEQISTGADLFCGLSMRGPLIVGE